MGVIGSDDGKNAISSKMEEMDYVMYYLSFYLK